MGSSILHQHAMNGHHDEEHVESILWDRLCELDEAYASLFPDAEE